MSKPRLKEVKKHTQAHIAEKLLNLTFRLQDHCSFPFVLRLLRLN